MPISFLDVKILPVLSYRTFASGGYIMTSKPMAIGTEIVKIFASASQFTSDGAILPRMRPIAIAAAIQSGKKRSRKLSDFVVCAMVSGVIDISMNVNMSRVETV